MKVSLNWAQEYSNVDLLAGGESKLLERINTQLGAIDEVVNWGDRYQGVLVVKIVNCQSHPEADNLKLCLVDDGGASAGTKRNEAGLVEIVCGGPNAREGMFAAWISPGTVLPSSYEKEKLVIETKEIRGQISQGMLASPAELGLGGEHEGILEITADDIGREPKPGEAFKNLYNLDDTVVDIENKMFTHRPDLFGILGVARELAGINGQAFSSPEWYLKTEQEAFAQTDFEQLSLKAENRTPEVVPRFMALAMGDISVKPSPYWLQAGLSRVGIKPVNNIVDITNFVMHLSGQPLHAFDYDKLVSLGKGLEVRFSKTGEKLTLLGGKQISLDENSLVIAALDGPPIALAGVMGGADTEVGPYTKNIVLECANFDMYVVRRSSMKYGLFTDASIRFTKGQSRAQNDRILAQCVKLINQLAGGKVACALVDINAPESNPREVKINTEFINQRLGLNLTLSQISKLLRNVEFDIDEEESQLKVKAPFWRTDINIAEDIVEEVGRLHGYQHLPESLPSRDLRPADLSAELTIKKKLRRVLASAGANETLNYSFVSNKLLEKVGQDPKKAFSIRNSLSPNLHNYRLSLLPSLLEKIHPNQKAGFAEFCLFEIGSTHQKDILDEDKLPSPQSRLAFLVAANSKSTLGQNRGAAYFTAKHYLEFLLNTFGLPKPIYRNFSEGELDTGWLSAAAPLEPIRSSFVYINGEPVGILGEPKKIVSGMMKLPNFCAGFEVDLKKFFNHENISQYRSLNKYPSATRDICYKTPSSVSFEEISSLVDGFFDDLQNKEGYGYSVVPIDIYSDKPADYRHTTFRINLWHNQKTLTKDDLGRQIEALTEMASKKLSAELI